MKVLQIVTIGITDHTDEEDTHLTGSAMVSFTTIPSRADVNEAISKVERDVKEMWSFKEMKTLFPTIEYEVLDSDFVSPLKIWYDFSIESEDYDDGEKAMKWYKEGKSSKPFDPKNRITLEPTHTLNAPLPQYCVPKKKEIGK